jgi:alcohol dehydrogenase/propanol-preferring alcohol dehydrogenase
MRATQTWEARKGGTPNSSSSGCRTPKRGEILFRAHACGLCHNDVMAKEGAFPGVSFPIVPGHEVAGEIAELGEDVNRWTQGQRVGVARFGGNCCFWDSCPARRLY